MHSVHFHSRLSTIVLAATAAFSMALPGVAADLKIDDLDNTGSRTFFTQKELEGAEPVEEVVTPEELEQMKQRFEELYPQSTTIPERDHGALEDKGVPQPVTDPGAGSPYWSTGKLVFKKQGETSLKRCTAQYVANNVLMTAAHCVYNIEAQTWNSDFNFLRAFDDGTYQQSVGWMCVSIFDAYHTPAKNYAFDYAFILVDAPDQKKPLAVKTGVPATTPLTAVGYPRNFGDGKRLYEVNGDWGSVARGIVTMSGNPMRSGNSGGAWFSEFKVNGDDSNNLIVSLNSHHLTGNTTDENGPLLTADTDRLFKHVQAGCK
ncbi:trypsin-like serine protease [Ciceribacter sp. L1K22]|uniref:trypsin-like serine peptidase n=1 Tax=Ciceribacter sp. L1K22 TaxID=2820275 RepID=UPI001ABED2D7|nr:trypsin-like serine protease [Ciceribacter sp. L1K22]MBO3759810.1 trypsin-like serine protease [Ciceribacter sp. L1K22]